MNAPFFLLLVYIFGFPVAWARSSRVQSWEKVLYARPFAFVVVVSTMLVENLPGFPTQELLMLYHLQHHTIDAVGVPLVGTFA